MDIHSVKEFQDFLAKEEDDAKALLLNKDYQYFVELIFTIIRARLQMKFNEEESKMLKHYNIPKENPLSVASMVEALDAEVKGKI